MTISVPAWVVASHCGWLWLRCAFAFLLLLLVFPYTVEARDDIRFTHLTADDGLNSNQSSSIVQDDKGFIWIGTWSGLNRYDGTSVVSFLNERDNPNSLADNYIWKLFKGSNDVLWIATFNGLSKFDLKTEKFTNYYHDENNPNSLAGDQVWSVVEDRKGRVWAATQRGLSRLDPATGIFKNYILPTQNGIVYETTNMTEDHEGGLWIGSNGGGLFHLNPETEQFVGYFHDENNSDGLNDNFIVSVREDSKNNLWVGTFNGLNKLLPDRSRFVHYQANPENPNSLSDNYVWEITEATTGELWIGTENGGLNIFNPETEMFTVYMPDQNKSDGISSLGVPCIFQDNIGRLWLSTYNGVDIYNPQRYLFSSYQKGTLNDPNVLSIYQDDQDVLWFGTSKGGLNRLDPVTGNTKYYLHDKGNPNSIAGNKVNAIYSSGDGVLWLGTDNGLNQFDTRTETFAHYSLPTTTDASENAAVNVVMKGDDEDTLWLGGVNLYAFNKTSGKLTQYPFIALKDEAGLAAPWLFTLLLDNAGGVWAGGDGGLTQVDPEARKFTHYYPDRDKENSLSNGLLQSLYQDEAGIIWVGTNDGLNKFDPVTQGFTRYFKIDGRGGSHVSSLVEDNEHSLWLSSDHGLSRFDPATGVVDSYDKRDGLLSNQFNVGATFKNKRGEIFFGGSKGVVYFDPGKIRKNFLAPDVVITGFSLFNKAVKAAVDSPIKQSIVYENEITLEYWQAVFGFEFTALNYWASQKNKYAYQLEGFDKDLVYTNSNHRSATYTNLDPGHYIFRVKASNGDEIWSNVGAEVRVNVLPPWWKTRWFRALVLALLALSLLLFYHWRVSSIKSRNRQLELQVRIRTHELSLALQAKNDFIAIMNHELRTPMSAIVGLGGLLNMEKLTQTQHDYVKRLINASRYMMQLINNILDFSKTEQAQFSLDSKPFHLDMALRSIHHLLLQQADQKGLALLLNNRVDQALVVVGDRAKLEQVLINLLMNGIKYTQDGKVTLHVTQQPCEQEGAVRLRFSVKDTGLGIPEGQFERLFEPFTQLAGRGGAPHREGVGLGLPISKRLVERMGGALRVNSVLDKGSEFFFELDMPLAVETGMDDDNTLQSSLRLPSGSRVLLVDDSELNRFVGSRMLQNMGAEVGQANSGRNAILQLQQYAYDLVLMDVSMADMDGMQVTRWIREQSNDPQLLVIALTAHAMGEMKQQCDEAGMNDFLSKPFEYKEMYRVVNRHLAALKQESVDEG